MRGEIEAYKASGGNMKLKHLVHTPSTYYIHEEVKGWLQRGRKYGIPISGPALQGKARQLALEIGEDMKAPNGWLKLFRARYNVMNKRVIFESHSVDQRVGE
jgi:hypothetical protein